MATVYFESFPEGHGYDYLLRNIRAVVEPGRMQWCDRVVHEPHAEPQPASQPSSSETDGADGAWELVLVELE